MTSMQRERMWWLVAVVCFTLAVVRLAYGAELKCVNKPTRDEFVTIESDKPGKWFVIGPTAITITETAKVASTTVGTTSVNFRPIITEDGGKRCNFVGPPGPYAVVQLATDEDEPSHLVVTIPGKVDPPPKPPGPDDDDEPDPPAPTDTAKILIVEETENRTAEHAEVFFQIRGGKLPASGPPVLIIDKDTNNQDYRNLVRGLGQSVRLPVVCFVDKAGKVTKTAALPKTFDAFVALIGGGS